MTQTGIIGNKAEKLAVKYLVKQGLRLDQCNFNTTFGEIDIIMWHGEYLVFVEVRHRKSSSFGGALESVDQRKQNKLRKTAEYFLIKNKITDTPCRFDILCINGNINKPDYLWISDAF